MPAPHRFVYFVVAISIVLACVYIAAQTSGHPAGQVVRPMCLGVSLLVIGTWIYNRTMRYWLEREAHSIKRDARSVELALSDRSREAELFARVGEIIETLAEVREVEAVLRRTTEVLKQILKVDVAVLQVYSDEQNKFFMKAEAGGLDINFCDNVVEDVLGKGMSRLLNDLSSYPRYFEMADAGYTSMLIAPLKRRSDPMGLLGVLSKTGRYFTDKELGILTTFTGQASLIIENAQLLEKTRALAIRDGLTSLFNHRHFQQTLKQQIDTAKDNNAHVALIMGDIDDFKKYNDTHGHSMGDIALRTVGRILIENTRGADIVARYGGEEFVIILPETDLQGASMVAENIGTAIAAHHFHGQERSQPGKNFTISLGVAAFPEDGAEPAELIDRADKAMYEAKKKGKNAVLKWREIAGNSGKKRR